MAVELLLIAAVCALAGSAVAGDDLSHKNVVSGRGDAFPRNYVPPLVSNGSFCLLVDYQGGQSQRTYVQMTPKILLQETIA